MEWGLQWMNPVIHSFIYSFLVAVIVPINTQPIMQFSPSHELEWRRARQNPVCKLAQ